MQALLWAQREAGDVLQSPKLILFTGPPQHSALRAPSPHTFPKSFIANTTLLILSLFFPYFFPSTGSIQKEGHGEGLRQEIKKQRSGKGDEKVL